MILIYQGENKLELHQLSLIVSCFSMFIKNLSLKIIFVDIILMTFFLLHFNNLAKICKIKIEKFNLIIE